MPELRTRDEFAVIGIGTRTSNTTETSGSEAKIPGLWNEYFVTVVPDRIPNKSKDHSTLAVYTNYESDHTQAYSLVVGRQVSTLEQIPEGMIGLRIPAGRYLVFSANGPLPEGIVAAWARIWEYFQENREYTRAYSSDFEIYGIDSNSAEIFIAVL
jgi:predicted transcriptional regulator YdeE